MPAKVTVEITGTDEVVQMIAQAVHDEFLPGMDGHDICNHSGGARKAIRHWAEQRGIALKARISEYPEPRAEGVNCG